MVLILLATDFEEAEALVPADLLRRADARVLLVGVTGREVTGAHGITVLADRTLEEVTAEGVELVVIPGGSGYVNVAQNPAAMALIRQVWDRGQRVAAICAAPTILPALGITDGRRAVCYPGMEGGLTGAIPCPGEQVVEDGRLITGQAPGAAYAFGLKLVEAVRGPEIAAQVAADACIRL